MIAGYLTWADVDPRTRPPLDQAAVAEIVRPLVTAAASARGPRFRDALVEQLERELIIAFGAWIAGWAWSASEPGGGGPIHARYYPKHSVFPPAVDAAGRPRPDLADADPIAASTARVVGSVVEWAHCLDELAEMFGELRAEAGLAPTDDVAQIEHAVECASSRLLPWVVHRTYEEDAWYATFTKLLAWYVESAGFEIEYARKAIAATVSGRFASWSGPTPEVAASTCAELGKAIGALSRDTAQTDATAVWTKMRRGTFNSIERIVHVPVRADGHQRFIEQRDRVRDAERAERMSAALVLCRDSARRGMALTFDQMCEWQAAVLGESRVEFRTEPAYAKGGREVYPFHAELRAQFEGMLAEVAAEPRIAIRAARVYLDVCFVHPFVDGNARAARLALDHVLTSAGYGLHTPEPVFVVSRTTEDRLMGWSLARVLERVIGPIAY